MHISRALVAAFSLSLALSGCCGSCRKLAHAPAEIADSVNGPDDKEYEQKVRERVRQDRSLAQKLCGVSTQGIKDAIVKKLGGGQAKVEGNTVEGHDESGNAGKGGGGAGGKQGVDKRKLLRCVAVLSVSWATTQGPSGKVWSIKKVEVDEVTTPGAQYTNPRRDHHDND